MAFFSFVKSRGYRNFMAKLYGIGASVVILGALFKINHYPGADIMLIIGLGTEAIIFFFSAWEPPHVEPDWSLVYPELAGMYHTGDEPKGQKKPTEELDDMLSKAKIDQELINSLGTGLRNLSENAQKLTTLSDASVATNEYVSNVKNASSSVRDLTDSYKITAEVLAKDAAVSEEYANNIKSVNESASNLKDSYLKASQSVNEELDATSEYTASVKTASNSLNALAEHYLKSSEMLTKSADALDIQSIDGKTYNEQMRRISDNLAALNSVYELQLQASNQSVESTSMLQKTIEKYLENLNASVDNTEQYKDNLAALNAAFELQLQGSSKQVESVDQLQETLSMFLQTLTASSEKTAKYEEELNKLTDRVTALNKVYGNMLTAMNINLPA